MTLFPLSVRVIFWINIDGLRAFVSWKYFAVESTWNLFLCHSDSVRLLWPRIWCSKLLEKAYQSRDWVCCIRCWLNELLKVSSNPSPRRQDRWPEIVPKCKALAKPLVAIYNQLRRTVDLRERVLSSSSSFFSANFFLAHCFLRGDCTSSPLGAPASSSSIAGEIVSASSRLAASPPAPANASLRDAAATALSLPSFPSCPCRSGPQALPSLDGPEGLGRAAATSSSWAWPNMKGFSETSLRAQSRLLNRNESISFPGRISFAYLATAENSRLFRTPVSESARGSGDVIRSPVERFRAFFASLACSQAAGKQTKHH